MSLYLLAFAYSWGIKVGKRHSDYLKNIKNNKKIYFMTARVIQESPLLSFYFLNSISVHVITINQASVSCNTSLWQLSGLTEERLPSCPFCHEAQIVGNLQCWLTFRKFLPSLMLGQNDHQFQNDHQSEWDSFLRFLIFDKTASSRKSPGCSKLLPIQNDGGHCVLRDLQCSSFLIMVPFFLHICALQSMLWRLFLWGQQLFASAKT